MKTDAQPYKTRLVTLLDDAAIARILVATRVKQLPSGLDKAQLKQDLNTSLTYFDLFDFSGPIGPAHKKLPTLIKPARRLRKGLDGSDSILRSYLVQALTDDGTLKQSGADKLESLRADLDKLISGLEAQNKNPPRQRRSIENLITDDLSKHYERHLERQGKITRQDDKITDGPFFRFVRAVSKEAGIPEPRTLSIETYLKRQKRHRRKNNPG
jgi:hypothetical protein